MAFSTIDKSTLYQNTVLYTGNGSTQSITGVGFQPDFTWIKKRSSVESHYLYDAVRGVTKEIYSNSTAAESTDANSLTAFGADGFSVGTSNALNENTETLASWNWKANGAGSLNEVGTIDSTVSVNTTSGFSIVKWIGTGTGTPTVGHGLGAAPKMIIVKTLDGASTSWVCYNEALGPNEVFWLNSTGASSTVSGYWGTPDSTTFGTLGAYDNNISGDNYIAYCFADVTGYSKSTSYTGNGNADGPFIYTGFAPKFVLLKVVTGVADGWWLVDNKQANPYPNPNVQMLVANTSAADNSSVSPFIDILSNGFKLKSDWAGVNTNGSTYIYVASGQPIISNSGVCANAR